MFGSIRPSVPLSVSGQGHYRSITLLIINCEAGEIIRLVASICLRVCMHVCIHLKGHSKWLGVQSGCCFDRLHICGRSRF